MTSLNEWIDMKVKGEDINYFKYNEFSNVEKVGEGAFGIVYKADWKSCGIKKVALKILTKDSSINEDSMNKFLKELKNLRKVYFHPNINQFFGVTKEPLSKNHVIVLQYANQGNLREYLKRNFDSFQWSNKIKMALDITCGLKCLHSRQIIHRDLHAKNILVHNNRLMIADLGLSKQLSESTSNSPVFGMPAYIEPQYYKNNNYVRDKKSDIYSLGVLFWEITSGYPPFPGIPVIALSYNIAMSFREKPIIGTPSAYVNLYKKCWDDDPNLRPTIDDVFDELEKISLNCDTSDEDKSEDWLDIDSETKFNSISKNDQHPQPLKSKSIKSTNSIYELSLSQVENDSQTLNESTLSHVEKDSQTLNESNLSQIEKDPQSLKSKSVKSTNSIYELSLSQVEKVENELNSNSTLVSSTSFNISESDRELRDALNKIFQGYLKLNNIGWTDDFDFNKSLKDLEEYNSKSQEIFNYLINDPTMNHYEVMVGIFYNNGFGTDKDEDKAFEWYMKASKQNDTNGHYEVGNCYKYGVGIEKNDEKAFEYYQLAADKGLNIALYFLTTCHECSYGTQINYSEAFELYKRSAENGFIPSQYFLARCYEYGIGTQKNKIEALKWYKLHQENNGDIDVTDKIRYIEKEEKELEQEIQDNWDVIISDEIEDIKEEEKESGQEGQKDQEVSIKRIFPRKKSLGPVIRTAMEFATGKSQ